MVTSKCIVGHSMVFGVYPRGVLVTYKMYKTTCLCSLLCYEKNLCIKAICISISVPHGIVRLFFFKKDFFFLSFFNSKELFTISLKEKI